MGLLTGERSQGIEIPGGRKRRGGTGPLKVTSIEVSLGNVFVWALICSTVWMESTSIGSPPAAERVSTDKKRKKKIKGGIL